jgi:hypothetical protein
VTEYVRVKDRTTGHEFSWPAHLVEAAGNAVTRLDKPAVDVETGDVAAPKHKTTVRKAAGNRRPLSRHSAPKSPAPAEGETGQQAETPKEND